MEVKEDRQITVALEEHHIPPLLQIVALEEGNRTKEELGVHQTILPLLPDGILKTLLTAIQPPIIKMIVLGGIIIPEISTHSY